MGRWQFSLRGLLAFVLIVAMAIALAITGWRLRQAEVQLDQYRREYGILQIDDPTTLCAIACWTPEPKCWRWRVYFPPGRYKVCYTTGGIPWDGIPKPQGGVTDDFDGATDVSVTVFQDKSDGDCKCALSVGHVSSCRPIPPTLDGGCSETSGVAWRQDIAKAGADNRLVLLRRRVGKKDPSGGSTVNVTEPYDGLMIWIERQGNSTGQGTVSW